MGLTIERLNLGSVQIDASCLVLNNLPGRKVRVPVWAYLVLGSDEGPVLVDSGYRETDVAIMEVMRSETQPRLPWLWPLPLWGSRRVS